MKQASFVLPPSTTSSPSSSAASAASAKKKINHPIKIVENIYMLL